MTEHFWFAEDCGNSLSIRFRCLRQVYSGQSPYARIDIVDTVDYGRMLFLDGIPQSAELDEFVYHESLVHPAMLSHPQPRKVCIIGGAEGATAREVCKYPSVERIVMVDIDAELVDVCRRYLSNWSQGSFEDSRLELLHTDGRLYLEETDEQFDVIIVDLDDPTEGSPAVLLFTQEFYRLLSQRLTPRGIASLQGESIQPGRLELHARMVNTLRTVFPQVEGYPYLLTTFHEPYAHIVAAKDKLPAAKHLRAQMERLGLKLRYLSPHFIEGLFRLPAYVEAAYPQFPQPIKDTNPRLYQH